MCRKQIIKIIVNLITTFRMIISFCLIPIIYNINKYISLIIIMSLFFTDYLDGFLARKFRVQTLYGSIMDAVADKALGIILLIPLKDLIIGIEFILCSEVIIALINIIGKLREKYVRTSIVGKFKMWALALTIIFSYFYYFEIFSIYLAIIMIVITIIFEIFVIVSYYFYLKGQKNVKVKRYAIKSFRDLLYMLFSTEYYLEQVKLND